MERKAFSPGGALKTPNMISIGKEIATRCSGLPLAAKFLGSLMHSKNKESNWLSIRENDMWITPESKIMPILKLSYDNLSPHLQRCFSYCSIFPKDCELSKQTLIRLWMAEGFLQPSNAGNNNCSFEDLGDEYFESLMWSSFFDGVKKNDLDDVTTFKMHDLVHDLAQVVVGDHECMTVKVTELQKLSVVRRLNLVMDKELSASFPKTINNINKLRTIIVSETSSLNLRRFSSNKHLRVLHLGGLADDLSEITYKTSKLKQLRYYHVTGLHLSSRYRSISRLYNLQTLVLSGCVLVANLVKEMGSLKHLRHLDMSSTDISELPDSVTSLHNLQSLDLNHCKNLNTFPESITGLECLRFLDLSFTPIFEIPNFVTSLRSLQTLDVNTCTYLKTLPEFVARLKKLSIFNFKNCPLLKALPKNFRSSIRLRYLNLDGTQINVLPESCASLYNLEYVNLLKCELREEVINWVKLRKCCHFDKGTPIGIGELIFLQSLSFKVNKHEFVIEMLGDLKILQALKILDLHNAHPVDAKIANLKGKQSLLELVLVWDETEEELGKRWPPTCVKLRY